MKYDTMGIFNIENNHKLIYCGSLINTMGLRVRLQEFSIPSIIKNKFESAILAGFGETGHIELFVENKHYKKAMDIVYNFTSTINLRIV